MKHCKFLMAVGAVCAVGLLAAGPVPAANPVLLYSRYFNAEGEARYLPEGTYAQVLKRLQRLRSKPRSQACAR